MVMKSLVTVFLPLLLVAEATAAPAGKLGDPAPPLQIADWTKGKPVNLSTARSNQVVVVEFWATWCAPCRTSIPHLTKLQKKFKGQVVFVGISDEPVAKVKLFVDRLGEQMDYVVACDDQRQTSTRYLGAYGIDGIPHAFVVDLAGRIVWQGHPMDGLETVLTEILAGKFDLARAQKQELGRQKLEEFIQLAIQDAPPDRQDQLAREIRALESEAGELTPGQRFDPATVRRLAKFEAAFRGYQVMVATNGPADQLAGLEQQLVANGPSDFNLAEFKRNVNQSRLFGEYFRAATGQTDANRLPELARQLGNVQTSNYELLNEWAWTLLTHEAIKHRDLELATRLARAALDACAGKEPGVLDTYARALFDSGKIPEAIVQQKKALALATDAETRAELQRTLEQYEARAAGKK